MNGLWVICIRLKLTFSYGELPEKLWNVQFFLVRTAVKFRNFQIRKTFNTDTDRIFLISFKVMYFLWDIWFEKLFRCKWIRLLVRGKSISKLKVLLWNLKKRNNPFLSKFRLKCLVYCQVFWVEVQRLQDQCISI